MLDTEKEKRQRAVKVAKAINSIEGVPIPDETNEFLDNGSTAKYPTIN